MKVTVLFSTQEGTTETIAEKAAADIAKRLSGTDAAVEVVHIKEFNIDSLPKRSPNDPVLFVLTTYIDGGPADDAAWFGSWLEDARFDFRVSKDSLSKLRFSVFGVGDSAYGENWCLFPRNVDTYVSEMAGVHIAKSVFADVGVSNGPSDLDAALADWTGACVKSLLAMQNGMGYSADGSTTEESGLAVVDEFEVLDEEYVTSDEEAEDGFDGVIGDGSDAGGEVMDLEDLGAFASAGLKAARKAKEEDAAAAAAEDGNLVIRKKGAAAAGAGNHTREMITPNLRKNLEKQGYKLIGSHSGVKLCRWTKSQMRNNGGCYKHTFYGIESHRCMETTPSLACANKCTFCWRHQTNPVGVEWRWKADLPKDIVEGALEKHRAMIKQMRGVPGVTPERFQEGMDVAHCALSLVGEPIMYPYINEFVDLLHEKSISSFLVTNAQFPELIRTLKPITQLYISVDAGTKESLKKIDRPLFSDFWERYNACLDEIAKKEQRTVFRLTLVKGFNVDELKNYANLVRRGKPDFVEVKGVTFCGYTGNNPLTMANVPFHEEVVDFVKMLAEEISDEYEISCEHAHTCSLLISHKKFKINGTWHTWIDYPKFHSLARSGAHFTSMDYLAPTPEWAVFGDNRKGFDPNMTRVYRNKAKYEGDPEGYKEKIRDAKLAAAAAEKAAAAAVAAEL
ncbi:S-adenosyl-L-methionine-dependent tRNA 4-demethylwyosine synthase [Chytriomyces hyalinus]|nr:S-adenosyl-L-methionine-dependent tRNA 4-demethylwyosine synthase [Chytriomyces hyalinus]